MIQSLARPESGTATPGIVAKFTHGGRDGPLRENRHTGLVSTDARWLFGRADAVPRLTLKELLDYAVFQRMEGDDDKPAAGTKDFDGLFEARDQGSQLVIDGDPECLKRARGGMDSAATTWSGPFDDGRELGCRAEWPGTRDCGRDPPAAAFLAVGPDEVCELGLAVAIHDV
jgi:hypothetical protein